MSEGKIERAPFDSSVPESRIENFSDFNLEIGDYVYSESGTRREVLNIVPDNEAPGGGYLEVERISVEGEKTQEKMDFQQLIDQQQFISRIDKPQWPKGTDVDSSELTIRQRSLLQKLEEKINQGEEADADKSKLLLRRARIIREVAEDINTKELQRENEVARTATRLEVVVNPERGNVLRRLVYEDLYEGATDWQQRRDKVAAHGYDPDVLQQLGRKVRELVKGIDRNEAIYNATPARMKQLKEYQLLVSSGEDNVQHTALTIGASLQVMRQMRKIIALSGRKSANESGYFCKTTS